MTTTLRPTEPLQQSDDGQRARHYAVCVNSRPVGTLHLTTHPVFGPAVAQITDLRIDEPDRGRGRATVAALAAEEVARGWGCERVEASVPAGQEGLQRLATALGYVERNRNMVKALPDTAPVLPPGSAGRPMTDAEYGPWTVHGLEEYAQDWIDRGVPAQEARRKAEREYAALLPDGLATAGSDITVLEHEGQYLGAVWVVTADTDSYVYEVEVAAERRGEGHGRSLMHLAEADALAAGATRIGLNVFAGNTPALRLYESLGYRPTAYHLYKPLL
jgi:ribosomal protein S18 acetylase RimI-like enzyme